eukprot:TCONS_00071087-protein
MYNIYTQELFSNIKALQIGTSLPNGLQTCIIVYADDILLLSPTLRNLQTLIDHCASFGKEHGLKFNQAKTKTQFVISGPTKIKSLTLTLNDCQISQQDTLTHLRFQWTKKKNHLCFIPKLLYGLELVDLTKSEMEYLDSQARACLKSLFNVSKRSKNDIHRLY